MDKKMVRRSICISEDAAKYLEECAGINCRSLNGMICWIIQQWINEDKMQGEEEKNDKF